MSKKQNQNTNCYNFKDEKNVIIPRKIACSQCGKEIGGNHKLIYERVMKYYNGKWNKYKETFICSDCKKHNKAVDKEIDEAICVLMAHKDRAIKRLIKVF